MEDLGEFLEGAEEELRCPICGARLLPAEGRWGICFYCGKEEEADFICENGHYVCEDCRLASGQEIVLRVAATAGERDPSVIADRMMTHPAVEISGPVHHAVTAVAILAAARNAGAEVEMSHIQRAVRRVSVVPYGACGLMGACGAALGAGAAISVLTGATYLSDRERSLALRVSSEALGRIAEVGGPRCCTASVYSSLESAVSVLRGELGLNLELRELSGSCWRWRKNPECHGPSCPYYPSESGESGASPL